MYAWWGCVNVYLASKWEKEEAKRAERDKYRREREEAAVDPVVPAPRPSKAEGDASGDASGAAASREDASSPADVDLGDGGGAFVATQPRLSSEGI